MGTIVSLGNYPLIQNARCYVPGRIQSRPGLSVLATSGVSANLHSVRRLNDYTVPASKLIAGIGFGLYIGTTSFSVVQYAGFSGNPLSLISFEPPSTPSPWMYIMDLESGGKKVNVNGTLYNQGIAPPLSPPTVVLGPPSYSVIDAFNESTVGDWVTSGTASGLTTNPNFWSLSIGGIGYDNGDTGLATITPSVLPATPPDVINFVVTVGTGSVVETVMSFAAFTTSAGTTIATITYASGSAGLCTIYPTSGSFVPSVGQLVLINGGGGTKEYCEVITSGTNNLGQVYFTCVTVNHHASGETIVAEEGFRSFLRFNHASGAALNSGYFNFTVTAGTGLFSELVPFNLSLIANRPLQVSTDTLSMWLKIQNPANVTNFVIKFDVDPAINNFTQNYYSYDAGVTVAAFTGNTWTQLTVPMSSFNRTGSAPTGWANVQAVGISVTATGNIGVDITSWCIFGQYGPNSTVSGAALYTYVQVYRSSVTGAVSNPGPANRPGISVDDESVVVTGIEAVDPQVDTADFYRLGGTLTNFLYVGSSPCSQTITPSILDDYGDTDIASAQILETDNDQPFTVPGIPYSGFCNTNGYVVTWVSTTSPSGGGPFNEAWPQGTEIIVGGQLTTLYTQPFTELLPGGGSITTLETIDSLGVQNNVPFQVPNPVLLGQSMQVMFGLYGEGNAGITMFACGNELNAGTIFWTNGNNADAAGASNNLQITSPSEALMNGDVYADQPFVFSIKRLFRMVPNFATDALGNTIGGFLAYDEGSGYGLFAPWAIAVGPKIYYLAGDASSIRENVLGGLSVSITDPDISLLFPHGESAAVAVQIGGVTIYPPNFTLQASLRLSWANSHLFFDYIDVKGNNTALVWNPVTRTWGIDTGDFGIVMHYADEGIGNDSLLAGGANGELYEFSNSASLDEAFTLPMPTIGDQGTYLLCRDLYLGAAIATGSTAAIVISIDGVNYSVPVNSTSNGGYQRLFYNLKDLKGQAWSWGFSSTGQAEIYLKDTEGHVKQWADKNFKFVAPFRDLSGATKP